MSAFGLRAAFVACAVVLATGAAPVPVLETNLQPFGVMVSSRFVAPDRHVVEIAAAVYPRDRVSLRVEDIPFGGPRGETLMRLVRRDVLAAVTGGYSKLGNRPDGLLVLDGDVRSAPRAGLSGVAGSAADGEPVVAPVDAVDVRSLQDAV
jgi:hypothetical protein